MVPDSSTIVSQRSIANTVDTDERTLQIGSLSKKPSTDDPGTKPPTHTHVDTTIGRIEQSPHHGQVIESNPEVMLPPGATGSLSFPSPPLVEEEEAILPHRSYGSGELFVAISGSRDSIDNPLGLEKEASIGVARPEDGSTQHGRSKRRRFLIVIVGVLVLAIAAIVAAVVSADGNAEFKNAKEDGNRTTSDGLEDSITSVSPTMAPSQLRTPAPTADKYDVDEEDIVLTSSHPTNTNQTSFNSSSNDLFEFTDDDGAMAQPVEEAPPMPSMLRRPTSSPTQTPTFLSNSSIPDSWPDS